MLYIILIGLRGWEVVILLSAVQYDTENYNLQSARAQFTNPVYLYIVSMNFDLLFKFKKLLLPS